MANFSSIAVRDTGTAEVTTVKVVINGITTEAQIIGIIDPNTQNLLGIDSNGRIELQKASTSTYSEVFVGVTTTATLLAAINSNRKSILIQNFSEAGSNDTVFLGPSGITQGQGIAITEGETYEDKDYTGALYGILSASAAAGVTVRIWERS